MEEKEDLVQWMAHIPSTTAAEGLEDLYKQVNENLKSEERLYELLRKHCPDTSRNIAAFTGRLDKRTAGIFEAHFSELVSSNVASEIASAEDRRRFYESAYTPIGSTQPEY